MSNIKLSGVAEKYIKEDTNVLDSSFLPNIKDIVSNLLLENIGAHAQQHFLNDSAIATLKDKDFTMTVDEFVLQRVTINDYFVNVLMIFRSRSSVEILGVLAYLSLEGKIEDWLNLFLKYVIVFFKEHDIYGVVRD